MASELLSRSTLVLNRNWQPVHVTNVARALTMLFAGTARAVDDQFQVYDWSGWIEHEPAAAAEAIRSGQLRVRIPEVMVLVIYGKMPRLTVSFSRRNLLRRDGFACQYCGSSPATSELTVDHVMPRSRGGESSWENCVLACRSCNRRKADRTPQQAGMRLRTVPETPHWRPDFNINGSAASSWEPFLSRS
ncbi:MAG: HNH endonuclease [Planctomycetales bacterium]|nr:HNH endonuclease [Planctomycetales bacterium]